MSEMAPELQAVIQEGLPGLSDEDIENTPLAQQIREANTADLVEAAKELEFDMFSQPNSEPSEDKYEQLTLMQLELMARGTFIL